MDRQRGFGLSEVLISLFLASIILTSLTQFYLRCKQQYNQALQILETQFEIQWISNLLADSIRRAGFTPCLSVDKLKTIDLRRVEKTINAYTIEPSEQSIQINRMNEVFTNNIHFISPTELEVPEVVVLNAHRPFMISDCKHAEVHQILQVDKLVKGQKVTLMKPLIYSYEASAYAGEWLEEKWSMTANARGIRTLHYQLKQTEELSTLIHSLHAEHYQTHIKQFIKVTLGLESNETHELNVAIRGS